MKEILFLKNSRKSSILEKLSSVQQTWLFTLFIVDWSRHFLIIFDANFTSAICCTDVHFSVPRAVCTWTIVIISGAAQHRCMVCYYILVDRLVTNWFTVMVYYLLGLAYARAAIFGAVFLLIYKKNNYVPILVRQTALPSTSCQVHWGGRLSGVLIIQLKESISCLI